MLGLEDFWQRMPSLFAEPPEVVIGITLPLACSLVRLEAKAARNKKHAKKYRRVQREVRALLRTEPASPVPVSALSQTIAFDPGQWHAELRPGAAMKLSMRETRREPARVVDAPPAGDRPACGRGAAGTRTASGRGWQEAEPGADPGWSAICGHRPRQAGRGEPELSKRKRFACWQCGGRMKKKTLACKRCKRTRPATVKAGIAAVTKARGAPVKPVPVPAAPKAPKPRCADPACHAKGRRKTNCCTRCGRPFSSPAAAAAQKAARGRQALMPGSAEYLEAQAAREYDPAAREALATEAIKARRAGGQENAHLAALLVKASGGRSLQEAYLRETDPRAQQILLGVLRGEERRWTA